MEAHSSESSTIRAVNSDWSESMKCESEVKRRTKSHVCPMVIRSVVRHWRREVPPRVTAAEVWKIPYLGPAVPNDKMASTKFTMKPSPLERQLFMVAWLSVCTPIPIMNWFTYV